jgi:ATP dependent DNA ligase C terminal region
LLVTDVGLFVIAAYVAVLSAFNWRQALKKVVVEDCPASRTPVNDRSPHFPGGIAALYLGKEEGSELSYVGKVGTGWSRTVSADLRRKLNEVVSPKSKLTKPVRKPKATWVEPKFFAEVEYHDITSEGLLRQSSFKGLSTKRN